MTPIPPESYALAYARDVPLETAKDMAMSEDAEMLLISGPIPMDVGYPEEEHKKALKIATLISMPEDSQKIAIYRIVKKDMLHQVVDDLERHGGYRCALVKPDGDIDPGYYL